MFGYVNPDKPELRIREFELYRGVYCAVCKGIGRQVGQPARLTLTYDLAFLALLLDSLEDGRTEGRLERCIAHPVRKHFIAKETPAVRYASDMNVLLAYHSLMDKWHDDRNAGAAAAAIALKGGVRRVSGRWPEQDRVIRERLAELTKKEKSGCASAEEMADEFGELMRSIFESPTVQDSAARKTLGWLGCLIGRWIYLIDAVDDLEKDAKRGSANPLLRQFEWKPGESIADFRGRIGDRLDFMLFMTLSEMEKTYELLDVRRNGAILENILLLGLAGKTDRVLKGSCDGHGTEPVQGARHS